MNDTGGGEPYAISVHVGCKSGITKIGQLVAMAPDITTDSVRFVDDQHNAAIGLEPWPK